MLYKFLNFCYIGRSITHALPIYLICLLLIPKIHFAQQLHISSPLPELKVTSPFGKRIHPILGIPKFHYGVDFKCQSDTIKSILNGEVIFAGRHRYLGNYITIKSGELEIIYAHLNSLLLQQKDQVCAGENIGISGKTGLATAEHLHLSIKLKGRYIDPISFLKEIQSLHLNTLKNN